MPINVCHVSTLELPAVRSRWQIRLRTLVCSFVGRRCMPTVDGPDLCAAATHRRPRDADDWWFRGRERWHETPSVDVPRDDPK